VIVERRPSKRPLGPSNPVDDHVPACRFRLVCDNQGRLPLRRRRDPSGTSASRCGNQRRGRRPLTAVVTCRAKSSSVAWASLTPSSRSGQATSDASYRPRRTPSRFACSQAHPTELAPPSAAGRVPRSHGLRRGSPDRLAGDRVGSTPREALPQRAWGSLPGPARDPSSRRTGRDQGRECPSLRPLLRPLLELDTCKRRQVRRGGGQQRRLGAAIRSSAFFAVVRNTATTGAWGIEPEREPYRVREGGSRLCFVQDPD
jgi:hypothetical protein